MVDSLIAWLAQYLLFVMAAGLAVVWIVGNRTAKIDLAAQAVIGCVLMVAFIYVAKSVHHDPRPFVDDPRITPLFGHSNDDGFPSDHAVAAALIAGLVAARHRVLGVVFAAGAVVIAWARVAAHVHHLQDVVAGLLLGVLAAAGAYYAVVAARRRLSGASSAPCAPR